MLVYWTNVFFLTAAWFTFASDMCVSVEKCALSARMSGESSKKLTFWRRMYMTAFRSYMSLRLSPEGG